MSEVGLFDWEVIVVSARYDQGLQSWMYTLETWLNETVPGETEEARLG